MPYEFATPFALMQAIEDMIKSGLRRPDMTQQDKLALVQGGAKLSEVRRRHAPKPLPVAPPQPRRRGQGFAPVPGLNPGWMAEREAAQEVANG